MCINSTTQPSNEQQPSPDTFIENSQNDTQKMNTFTAYEKAIEGYQFQVGRYNIWMNYYAIFVGALFVALYSIWPKSEIETLCCACKPVCSKVPVAIAESQEWFLPLIISVLGWIASLCWYGALLGYRKWNDHWIGVIQKIERIIVGKEDPSPTLSLDKYLKVYLDMPKSCSEDATPRYVKGFISTQKITGIFIFFAALAWGGVIAYILSQWCFREICRGILWLALGGLTIAAVCCLHHCKLCLYSSGIITK